ncbi:MAG: hypothetical protein KatS3mg013_0687 [Actinomycetota bacterium]|jgi:uncharacterized protein YcbX|nr:MAG: hypothetical protein KatS3mg013_0687 [Actinomycetota bacterium]
MPTLARINVTPVKSMALHHPERARVGIAGIEGDRRFFLVDPSGALVTAADAPELLRIRPRYDASRERLALTLPDGSSVADAVDRLGPPLVTDLWGHPLAGRIVEGTLAEAIGSAVGRPLRLARCEPTRSAVDVHPVTLVSSASVARLGADGGAEALDARRFRMTLELDGCAPYEEDGWTGRVLRVGGARLLVGPQVPRCVVTTLNPDTGRKDFPTLTVIARTRTRIEGGGGLPFGMYARVLDPGALRVGDPVEIDERASLPDLG